MKIKALSEKKIKETLEFIFETNSIHFKEDKWDLNYTMILENIIDELLGIDISYEIIKDLRDKGNTEVSIEYKGGDIFNGTQVLRSSSHNSQVYYNYVSDTISTFSYPISINSNKDEMIYIGELI